MVGRAVSSCLLVLAVSSPTSAAPAASGAGPPAFVPGRLVFEAGRDGNHEIYAMDSDGAAQTRLTADPDADDNPA